MFLTHLFVENNANDYGLLIEVHSKDGALHQFRKALYKLIKECYCFDEPFGLYRRLSNIIKGAEKLEYAGHRFEIALGNPDDYFDIEWLNENAEVKNCVDVMLGVSYFKITQKYYNYDRYSWEDDVVIEWE